MVLYLLFYEFENRVEDFLTVSIARDSVLDRQRTLVPHNVDGIGQVIALAGGRLRPSRVMLLKNRGDSFTRHLDPGAIFIGFGGWLFHVESHDLR